MARSRNIKPSFFTNDRLGECEPLARLIFAGLWTIADREGRLEDRPKKIRAEVLPYDECDPDSLLNLLVSKGFIIRYRNNDIGYIQILSFTKHQNPHVKEQASIIPAPDMHQTCTIQAGPLTDSLNPLTDSLLLIPSIPKPGKKPALDYSSDFKILWELYPRKDGSKKKAFENYQQALKEGIDHGRIESGIRSYAVSVRGTENRYIAHFASWLNQRRWESVYTSTAFITEPSKTDRAKAAIMRGLEKYERTTKQ